MGLIPSKRAPVQVSLEDALNIVIVGPTNVGKSTLFNRLTRTRRAIVRDEKGVTVDWQDLFCPETPAGFPIYFVDTGGIGDDARNLSLGAEVEQAALQALHKADLVFFVLDGTHESLRAQERDLADWLRRNTKVPAEAIWCLVNKADRKDFDIYPFYELGLSQYFPISSEHNQGIDLLWDALEEWGAQKGLLKEPSSLESLEDLPVEGEDRVGKKPERVVIVGRPNVGKSTLMNHLMNEERSVVSSVSGTTRDVVWGHWDSGSNFFWELCDTAGMRRPGKRGKGVEWVAGEKLKDALRKADLGILLIDSTEGVSDLDASLAGMIQEYGLSLVLALNKWDLISGATEEEKLDKVFHLERTADRKLQFLKECPQVKISAKTGKGLRELKNCVKRLLRTRQERVQTSVLNNIFDEEIQGVSHPSVGQRGGVKFYYISQIDVGPPEFVVFSNIHASKIHFSFRRYVENVLRKNFDFEGAPIKIHFKKQ